MKPTDPKLRWLLVVLAIAAAMGSTNLVHGLWHVDESMSGYHHRTFMSWADPCLSVGMVDCHTAVVLVGEFALPLWLGAWAVVYWLRWRREQAEWPWPE